MNEFARQMEGARSLQIAAWYSAWELILLGQHCSRQHKHPISVLFHRNPQIRDAVIGCDALGFCLWSSFLAIEGFLFVCLQALTCIRMHTHTHLNLIISSIYFMWVLMCIFLKNSKAKRELHMYWNMSISMTSSCLFCIWLKYVLYWFVLSSL